MPQIAPPPARTGLLDKLGNISVDWLGWLRSLKTASESGLDLEVLEAFAEINETRPEDLTAGLVFGRSEERVDLEAALLESLALHETAKLDTLENLDPFIRSDRNWSELRSDEDTFANRTKYPAAAMPEGSLFRATDKLVVWQKRNVGGTASWVYVAGIWRDTLANIPTASLGTADAGLLFEATDYAHVLRWSGSAWAWGPGESGSGYFADFPFAPIGGVWQLCDGTAVTYLKGDGTTGSYTTKNLTGHYRKSVTSGADALASAVAPTFSGGSTDSAAANITTTTLGATTGSDFNAVTGVSDTGHTHGLSGGTVGTNGEPPAFKVLTYFRR